MSRDEDKTPEVDPDVIAEALAAVKVYPPAFAVLDMRLDRSRVSGGLAVAVRDRPSFSLDLRIDQLNADAYLQAQKKQGFGLMYAPANGYGWGSNQSVIQTMIVVATAHDITGDKRYLQAVRESMDYILGRNALGISYVAGYGTTYAHNQFSYMCAASTDPSFPPPPKGALAGGPNSGLADDYAISKLQGCSPQGSQGRSPQGFFRRRSETCGPLLSYSVLLV